MFHRGGDPTSRKRIANREAREIAAERMRILMSMAEREAMANNHERGRRYVYLAARIGMRTNAPMPKDRMYCHRCLIPLIPGRNCRVRLRSRKVVIHCLECGQIRRMPYIREKKEGRKWRVERKKN